MVNWQTTYGYNIGDGMFILQTTDCQNIEYDIVNSQPLIWNAIGFGMVNAQITNSHTINSWMLNVYTTDNSSDGDMVNCKTKIFVTLLHTPLIITS